jgi:hypothetical protein
VRVATSAQQSTSTGFDYVRWFRYLSFLVAALVVIQAALAGRYFFFGRHTFLTIHENVGNFTFIVGVVMVNLALRGYRKGALDRADFVISAILFILITVQLALGYAGKDNKWPASLHWPNGVLITALTATLLGRTLPRRPPPLA